MVVRGKKGADARRNESVESLLCRAKPYLDSTRRSLTDGVRDWL